MGFRQKKRYWSHGFPILEDTGIHKVKLGNTLVTNLVTSWYQLELSVFI